MLCGGVGNDTIFGNSGDDLIGGAGNDRSLAVSATKLLPLIGEQDSLISRLAH